MIKYVKDEIISNSTNDDVLEIINSQFIKGREYSFQEQYEITIEGKHRFEYSIPPGYEDLKNKKKKGIQIFGDLIIWKQIIEYAKSEKKSIIFVCNDLKEDWCYLTSDSEKRIDKPREELIKEIYDYANVEFWMYNLSQFLYKSNEYYDANIEKRNIDNLSLFISANSRQASVNSIEERINPHSNQKEYYREYDNKIFKTDINGDVYLEVSKDLFKSSISNEFCEYLISELDYKPSDLMKDEGGIKKNISFKELYNLCEALNFSYEEESSYICKSGIYKKEGYRLNKTSDYEFVLFMNQLYNGKNYLQDYQRSMPDDMI